MKINQSKIIVLILLLASTQAAKPSITKVKDFPEFVVTPEQTVSLPITSYFDKTVENLKYKIDPTTTGVEIDGLMSKVLQQTPKSHILKNCTQIRAAKFKDITRSFALCNKGTEIWELDGIGYLNGVIQEPKLKKNGTADNKKKIPFNSTITSFKCTSMSLIRQEKNNLSYAIYCKGTYKKDKTSKEVSKILIPTVQFILADNAKATDPLTINFYKQTNEGYTIDSDATADHDDLVTIISGDKSGFIFDQFQTKTKKGFSVFQKKSLDQSKSSELQYRTYIKFTDIKKKDGKAGGIDTKFIFSTLTNMTPTSTSNYVILSGSIPDASGGSKLAVYKVSFKTQTAKAPYHTDFKVEASNTSVLLKKADWVDFTNIFVGSSFKNTYVKLNVLTFNRQQIFAFKIADLSSYTDKASTDVDIKNISMFNKLNLTKESADSFPRYLNGMNSSFDVHHFIVYTKGKKKKLITRSRIYKTMSEIEVPDFISLSYVDQKDQLVIPTNIMLYYFVFTDRIEYYELHKDVALKLKGSDIKKSDKIKLKVSSYTTDVAKELEIPISIKKLSSWNDQPSIDNLEMNQALTYGKGWIDIPLGQDNIHGNAAKVLVTAEGRSENQIEISMANLRKFNMEFNPKPASIDGIIPLNKVNSSTSKEYYFAYMKNPSGSKEKKHKWWVFECTDLEANKCIQSSKGSIDAAKYTLRQIGFVQDKSKVPSFSILAENIEKSQKNLVSLFFKLVDSAEQKTFLSAEYKYATVDGMKVQSITQSDDNTYMISAYKDSSDKKQNSLAIWKVNNDLKLEMIDPKLEVTSTTKYIVNNGAFVHMTDSAKVQNTDEGWSYLRYLTYTDTKGNMGIRRDRFKKDKTNYVKESENIKNNWPLYTGTGLTTCMLRDEALIIDKAKKVIVFKTFGNIRSGTISFKFDDLQLKSVLETVCLGTHAQILYYSTKEDVRLMTIDGDTPDESDEKIHSIVKLPNKDLNGLHALKKGKKIMTTLFKSQLSIASDKLFVVTNLDGPTLKVQTDGLSADVDVKIKAQAGNEGASSPEKIFQLKFVKNDMQCKLKNNASKSNKFNPEVGKWIDMEKFAIITGPTIDIGLKVEKDEDKTELAKLNFQGRKYKYYETNVTDKKNDQKEIIQVGDFVMSIHDQQKVFILYKSSPSKPKGDAQTHFLQDGIATGKAISQLTAFKVSDTVSIFGFNYETKVYLFSVSAVKSTSATTLKVAKLIEYTKSAGTLKWFLIGDKLNAFIIEVTNSLTASYVINWYKYDPNNTKIPLTLKKKHSIDDSMVRKHKSFSFIRNKDNHISILTYTDKSTKVNFMQVITKADGTMNTKKFKPFNIIDQKNDKIKMFLKSVSCKEKSPTTNQLVCLIAPSDAGVFIYEMSYTIGDPAKTTLEKAPVSDVKQVMELKTIPNYSFHSGNIGGGDDHVLCLKRNEISKSKTPGILDSYYILVTYAKQSKGYAFSVLGNEDLYGKGINPTIPPAYFYNTSTDTKLLYVGNPLDSTASKAQIKVFNIKSMQIQVKKTSSAARLLEETKSSDVDFSKIQVDVKSVDSTKKPTEKLSLKQIIDQNNKEEIITRSSVWIWILVIILIVGGVLAAALFIGKKKNGNAGEEDIQVKNGTYEVEL